VEGLRERSDRAINLGIRRRLAPLLANSRRKIELLNILLFSMPGTPVIYYGDEIGMGDNVYLGDRNGVRTPMQWSADRNAGFSRANPQQLLLPIIIDPEYNYEAINVENQQKNLSSLLWWTRRVIAMRKNFKAFSRGKLEFLFPENAKVLAFLRQFEGETVLVVVNLSRFSQVAELDLSRFSGCALMEVFGQNYFPAIKDSPYILTLGPHSHFWFVVGPQPESAARTEEREIPTLRLQPSLATLLQGEQRKIIEREILPGYVRNRRWFASKARSISGMRVAEQVAISSDPGAGQIWFVEVTYRDGAPETYTLPVQISRGDAAREVAQSAPHAVIARFEGSEETILQDAVWDAGFRETLFRTMAGQQHLRGATGEVVGISGTALTDPAAVFHRTSSAWSRATPRWSSRTNIS
jgi:maltose alpha-D-glucosyltransferase/alpha-amylase